MPVHYGSRELDYVTISSPLTTQLPQAAGSGKNLTPSSDFNDQFSVCSSTSWWKARRHVLFWWRFGFRRRRTRRFQLRCDSQLSCHLLLQKQRIRHFCKIFSAHFNSYLLACRHPLKTSTMVTELPRALLATAWWQSELTATIWWRFLTRQWKHVRSRFPRIDRFWLKLSPTGNWRG